MKCEDEVIITVKGTRYLPIFFAVWAAQASDRTIRHWIDKSVSFNGKAIQSYTSPRTGELYLSEDSVKQLETRFVKWPSKKPAGRIVIGETKEHDGFFQLPAAAKIVGVSPGAMWTWANRGEVPSIPRSLDVVKCPISNQLYIREKDALDLAETRRSVGLKHSRVRSTDHKKPTRRQRPSASERV
jgi:hypothetical protein